MDAYVSNRSCYCSRCRTRGYMGPVVLITLGVLFLLSEFTHWHFHQTWPILLIAIGVVKVLGSSADTSGHVPPFAPYPGPAGNTPPPQPQPAEPPQEVNHV